jgi:cytochrome d ubiquinol oxidase subunit I
MEFQFGTNWAAYSRHVGDIFGAALAAEGIFAFFLESGFLAILLFGWDKVKPRTHFFSTLMVALGAHFSAIWIVVANSWQQTPAGFHLVPRGDGVRAELTNFFEAVLNPSFLDRISHVYMGAWQAGAFLVLSVSAFFLLRNRHREIAKASMKLALGLAVFASVLQLVTGHSSALGVAENQPAKLAAFEGLYETDAPADLFVVGWVNEAEERTVGLAVPGGLSWLLYGDAQAPVTGLDSFAPEDRPPVNLVFQSYHLMVAIGMLLIAVALVAAVYWWRGKLFETRWFLWVLVFSVLGPQLANQLGWLSAEVGRQPWIVYEQLRTADALSVVVSAGDVLISLTLFGLIYLLLFILFIYLLNEKIQHGPKDVPMQEGRMA